MPRQANIVRVLIASPSDVSEVRALIPPLFTEWNAFGNRQAMLEAVMWEHAGVPEMGIHPQDALDNQLISSSDLLVAVFWTRIGTATAKHISGTIQEIETFKALKGPKRVMIYFIDKPTNTSPMALDLGQLQQLRNYRTQIEAEGLLWTVPDESELKLKLYQHLEAKVNALLRNELPEPSTVRVVSADDGDDLKWSTDVTIVAICFDFERYWIEMCQRGDKYRDEGGRLAARFARAIDRFVSDNQYALSDGNKQFLREQSHSLKKMQLDARSVFYRKSTASKYWDDGRAIAERLSVHARFMSKGH